MAENITLNNVATFQNDTTAVNVVNNNNAAITTAFVDVLSRSGVSPNPMLSTLDMNNNQIVNLPFPTTLNSPARLADVTNAQNISIISATTGTSGHVVPFLDGTNTWSAPQTFNAFGIGTTTGLTLGVSTGVVTSGSSYNAGIVNFTDAINVGANFSNGFTVNQAFGGSTLQGGRAGLNASLTLTSATNAANPNRNYLAVQGIAFGNSADGGTNPNSIGTSAGLLFGGFFQSNLGSSSTSLQQASALGGSLTIEAESSAWAKTLLQLSSNPADAVNGSAINTMIWLNNDPGSTAKWTNAILIDNQGGIGTFPIATTGTIFKTGTGSCATGIDFTSTTFSGNPFQSVNFSVTSAGIISSGSNGASNGTLQLFGLTSGNLTLFSNNTANLLTISQ